MATPEDNRYAKSHEYVHLEGDIATIGITEYAQKELGDVVFVELPQVDTELEAGDELGSIESVKAVSELFTPVSGVVIEIDRKSTRLNSSHLVISYAVFCLKKKRSSAVREGTDAH